MALHTFRLREQASSCQTHDKRFMELIRQRKLLQGQDEELELSLRYWVSHFLDLWAAHAPIQHQGSIRDWYQEVEEK